MGIREKLPDGYSSLLCLVAEKPRSAGEYQFESYASVAKKVQNLASGLVELGLTPKSHVGIYAKNRPEWAQTFAAAQAAKYPHTSLVAPHKSNVQPCCCPLVRYSRSRRLSVRYQSR